MRQRFVCFAFIGMLMIAGILNLTVPAALAVPAPSQIQTLQGVIKLVDVEGGCYQLTTPDGRKYELIGQFPHRDGLRVQVKGTVQPDLMTICQVGQPFQVSAVKVLKP